MAVQGDGQRGGERKLLAGRSTGCCSALLAAAASILTRAAPKQFDYKGFSPSVDHTNVDYSSAPAIQARLRLAPQRLPADGAVAAGHARNVGNPHPCARVGDQRRRGHRQGLRMVRPTAAAACRTNLSRVRVLRSGGGRGIIRVDVSADGGSTWQTADITAAPEQSHKGVGVHRERNCAAAYTRAVSVGLGLLGGIGAGEGCGEGP